MSRIPCVYLLTNFTNSVLYTGVTSDLKKRLWEHRSQSVNGFSERYRLYKLVHYEVYESMRAAIVREKQIKGWTRIKKNRLVEQSNPKWKDRADEILGDW